MTVTDQDVFEHQRGRLFGIAYRMLGTATDAEDIVQDAWIRWSAVDQQAIDNPAAFLATIVTRLSLTALTSARARRETYVGPWLPEPVSTENDPLLGAERGEALSLAVLLLLERLSPPERGAYVLREAFQYSFADIAAVLEVSEANARQLASRARKNIEQERHAEVSPAERNRLLAALVAALQSGELAALEALLTEHVVTISDGGGIVSAARKPVFGRERVATFLTGILAKFAPDFTANPVSVNGEIALLGMRDGAVQSVVSVDFSPQGVAQIMIVLNPQKLVWLERHIRGDWSVIAGITPLERTA
ncbi:MAG: RNA polymerase sigma-70 factor [Rhodoglobus sp.]